MNQIEEQSANASSSVTENVSLARSSSSSTGSVSCVGRENAPSARTRRRSQPFAYARACASSSSRAASAVSARRRSRSVGARLDPPGELRQRPALRPACDVVRREERAGLVPERARLAGRAVVGRRFADEVEPPRGARARRVEEVALARDRVRPRQPRAAGRLVDRPALLVGEERRALLAAREASLLQPEQEDDLGPARSRAEEVGDRDAAGSSPRASRSVARSSAP